MIRKAIAYMKDNGYNVVADRKIEGETLR